MFAHSVMIVTLSAVFAFLTALAFTPIADTIEGAMPGWGYFTLFLAAGAGVSPVIVPDAFHRRHRG